MTPNPPTPPAPQKLSEWLKIHIQGLAEAYFLENESTDTIDIETAQEEASSALDVIRTDMPSIIAGVAALERRAEEAEAQAKVSEFNKQKAQDELRGQCKDLRDALNRAGYAEAQLSQLREFIKRAEPVDHQVEKPWFFTILITREEREAALGSEGDKVNP